VGGEILNGRMVCNKVSVNESHLDLAGAGEGEEPRKPAIKTTFMKQFQRCRMMIHVTIDSYGNGWPE
jgi:hypothetical protein